MKSLLSCVLFLALVASSHAADLVGRWKGPQEHQAQVVEQYKADGTVIEYGVHAGTWNKECITDTAKQRHYYRLAADGRSYTEYKVVLPDGSEVKVKFTFKRI